MKEIAELVITAKYRINCIAYTFYQRKIKIKKRPTIIMFDETTHIFLEMVWLKKGRYHRIFGPTVVENISDSLLGEEIFLFRWATKSGVECRPDIEEWLHRHAIILCKENYFEIPDEYKAEFKLIFH